MLKIGLILLSLTFIASCCKPVKEIEYVDRVEYRTPVIDKPVDTLPPEWKVSINGDMIEYREKCEAQIKKCNIDKRSMYNGVIGDSK